MTTSRFDHYVINSVHEFRSSPGPYDYVNGTHDEVMNGSSTRSVLQRLASRFDDVVINSVPFTSGERLGDYVTRAVPFPLVTRAVPSCNSKKMSRHGGAA